MTDSARTSRWSRRFVLTGAVFLLGWQLLLGAGVPARAGLVVGLLGFVFHTIFGKAYSLVPTYFDRTLITPRLMPVHLVLTATGTVLLAADTATGLPSVGMLGAAAWVVGIAIFLGTLFATIGDNLTGAATGTGDHNEHREYVDRRANAAVPIALAYLAGGSYELLALQTTLPTLFDGYAPRALHLLAAGTGALFVFAVGFRLLPRFFAARPPDHLAVGVLAAGAVGPALLAPALPGGTLLQVGAVVQSVAVLGYTAVVGTLLVRTDRTRVGRFGVALGALAGVAGITLGLFFAFDGVSDALRLVHFRLNVLGLLGLTIVGVSYQFYPPAVVSLPVDSDTVALAAIGALAGGLVLELAGALTALPLATAGRSLAVLGATLHLGLLLAIFVSRGEGSLFGS